MTWDDGNPYVDQLADGVYAYVQPDGGWMVNNCGVVVDGSGDRGPGRHHLHREAQPGGPRRGGEGEQRRAHARWSTPTTTRTTPTATASSPHETLVIGHDKCREMVLAAGLEATKVITAPDYGDLTLRPPEITFPTG